MEAAGTWAVNALYAGDRESTNPVDTLTVPPGAPLDCPGTSCGAGRDGAGYGQWIFVEYLAERFGDGIVREVFEHAAAIGGNDGRANALDAIAATVAAHGVD